MFNLSTDYHTNLSTLLIALTSIRAITARQVMHKLNVGHEVSMEQWDLEDFISLLLWLNYCIQLIRA